MYILITVPKCDWFPRVLSGRKPAADAFPIATPHINARPSRERIVTGSILFYIN